MGLADLWRGTLDSLTKRQEYAACDGIRAIAVLWVCSDHGMRCYQLYVKRMGRRLYELWWPLAIPASGEVGVDLFLVLSGFLIGSYLQRDLETCGKLVWRSFYLRRIFRILPAFFSAIAATMASDVLTGNLATCPNPQWWANLLVLNNIDFFKPAVFCIGQSWSVTIELQLYFITPPLFKLSAYLSSLNPRFSQIRCMCALCLLLWIVSCATRLHFALTEPLEPRTPEDQDRWHLKQIMFYVGTHYRYGAYVAGLAAGVLVASRSLTEPPAPASGEQTSAGRRTAALAESVVLVLAAVVLAASCVYGGDLSAVADLDVTEYYRTRLRTVAVLHTAFLRPLIGLAVAASLALSLTGRAPLPSRILSAACWRPIAGLSYSMYLLQFVGLNFLEKPYLLAITDFFSKRGTDWQGIGSAYLGVALFIIGVMPLAFLNYALVERPGITGGRYLAAAVLRPPAASPLAASQSDDDGKGERRSGAWPPTAGARDSNGFRAGQSAFGRLGSSSLLFPPFRTVQAPKKQR